MSAEKTTPAHAASTPTAPCDVCDVEFKPGDRWWYHARLRVYIHPLCGTHSLVRGEDVTTHTMMWGQVPRDAAPQTTPQDAQNGTQNSLEGVPGGERTSQGADGASVRSLGDRLRAVATAHQTARPEMAAHIAGMADEADRLERQRADFERGARAELAANVKLAGELEQARGDLAAQEGIAQEQARVIERVRVLAAAWDATALNACDGEDHGGSCADCNGRGYAAELRVVLDGGTEADHVHDWGDDTTHGDSARGVRHYCCTLPGCTAQREEPRP